MRLIVRNGRPDFATLYQVGWIEKDLEPRVIKGIRLTENAIGLKDIETRKSEEVFPDDESFKTSTIELWHEYGELHPFGHKKNGELTATDIDDLVGLLKDATVDTKINQRHLEFLTKRWGAKQIVPNEKALTPPALDKIA